MNPQNGPLGPLPPDQGRQPAPAQRPQNQTDLPDDPLDVPDMFADVDPVHKTSTPPPPPPPAYSQGGGPAFPEIANDLPPVATPEPDAAYKQAPGFGDNHLPPPAPRGGELETANTSTNPPASAEPGASEPQETEAVSKPQPAAEPAVPPPSDLPAAAASSDSPLDPQAPQKYTVLRSFKDSFSALKFNFPVFLIVTVIGYLVSSAIFLILFLVNVAVFGGIRLLDTRVSGSTSMVQLILIIICLFLWSASSYAFINIMTSSVLYEATNRRKLTIGAALRRGVQRLIKVLLANALVYLVIAAPIFAMIIISVPLAIASSGSRAAGLGFLLFFAVAYLGAVLWMIIALLRYSLAPFVAIFEPEVGAKASLGRSRHLLKSGGQWFIFKGFMLIVLLLIILAVATGNTLQELDSSDDFLVNSSMVLISLIANGCLVMLYRNRRMIRG